MAKYHHKAARSEAQLKKMQELSERGVCAFCPEHLAEAEGKVIFSHKGWTIKYNGYPYEGTKLHLLLIPNEHVKTVSELDEQTQADFLGAVAECEKKFSLQSYAVAMRSGDMRYNGGSVEHLHAHIVVGATDDPAHEPVRFKMTSRP